MGANTKFCHIVNFVFAPIQLIQNLQYERERERERERGRERERERERERIICTNLLPTVEKKILKFTHFTLNFKCFCFLLWWKF